MGRMVLTNFQTKFQKFESNNFSLTWSKEIKMNSLRLSLTYSKNIASQNKTFGQS